MLVDITVPGLLRDCTGGRAGFKLDADTIQGVLDALLATYPLLRVHLFTESGGIREHVLLYYNDDNIAWLENLDVKTKPGDRLQVLQAVSGG